ncbi:MAG: hypothetical protein EOR84_09065 [Mesorhizobium sp.]|uniref:hypothetical protein n=1 Tax=Mesorhizobium sp. TaxID=1871066 RepID=UPI000FE72EEC|nr:hypothetical protein [Mesorhizobium sp.]RWM99597.1 MAG: hypothetical protein EOR84_09065 [Mesorhizobium sp.]
MLLAIVGVAGLAVAIELTLRAPALITATLVVIVGSVTLRRRGTSFRIGNPDILYAEFERWGGNIVASFEPFCRSYLASSGAQWLHLHNALRT